ncbi:hypothetical protein [Candidatus Villigracilis saccharophilus]|uniref:hypothetical protein n=1 Tax=Candidatus Villigracilis saccharophilus TaxID=3140684 RepID=UPI0031374921|nr:hypothetical protein [Anaerolineales bacterium]
MAGMAYFRARGLLREQAITQSQNLLTNQLKLIDREIKQREALLANQIENEDFRALIELGLHANPMNDQFDVIQNDFIKEFQRMNTQEGTLYSINSFNGQKEISNWQVTRAG